MSPIIRQATVEFQSHTNLTVSFTVKITMLIGDKMVLYNSTSYEYIELLVQFRNYFF